MGDRRNGPPGPQLHVNITEPEDIQRGGSAVRERKSSVGRSTVGGQSFNGLPESPLLMEDSPDDPPQRDSPGMKIDRDATMLPEPLLEDLRIHTMQEQEKLDSAYRFRYRLFGALFWISLFFMSNFIFLYFTLQDFKLSNVEWYLVMVVMTAGMVAFYILHLWFECLSTELLTAEQYYEFALEEQIQEWEHKITPV